MFWNKKPENTEITFETIKAAFPTATLEHGILKLPNNSYNDLKKKFSNLTPDLLKSKFFAAQFGKMSDIDFKDIRGQFPDAKNENKKLILPTSNFNDLKSKFPDVSINGLKSKFIDISFGKPEELSYVTVKEYFPNTRYENGKLILPDIGFKDLKTKFANLTVAQFKSKFPNFEFGKMSDINILDVKAEFPNALIKDGKLLIPGIKFDDFKNKFPDATPDRLKARFGDYNFDAVVNPIPTSVPKPTASTPTTTSQVKPTTATPTPAAQVKPTMSPTVATPAATPTVATPTTSPTVPKPASSPTPVTPTAAPVTYDCVKVTTFTTKDSLYLRKGPNTNTLAYLLMNPGTKVIAIGAVNDWLRVINGNFVAYCHKDYVTQDADWKKTSMPSGKEDTYGPITAASNESLTIDFETMRVAKNVIIENIANGNVVRSDMNSLTNAISIAAKNPVETYTMGIIVKNDAGEAAYIIFRN